MEDSSTVPQSVHTASALEGSTSISVEPQQSHFRPFLVQALLTLLELTLESEGLITDMFYVVVCHIFQFLLFFYFIHNQYEFIISFSQLLSLSILFVMILEH